MKRAALAALLVALTGALVGCGGGGAPDLSGVAQAAQKTEDAGTARFELSVDAEGASSLSAEGAVDYERQRARMSMDLGSLGGLLGGQSSASEDLALDVIIDGKVFYMRFPLLSELVGKGRPWLKMDLEQLAEQSGADLGQLDQLSQLDPSQALTYLRGAGEFSEVGDEDVRGVPTTRYEGTIDLRAAVDEAPADQRKQLEQLLEGSGVSELPAEAWIDGDGYLRKLTLDFSALAEAPFSMAMELFDFGGPVELDLPSDDEVTDITELASQGGLGG